MSTRRDRSPNTVSLNYRAPGSSKEWKWLRRTPGFIGLIIIGSLCTVLSILLLAAFHEVAESRVEMGYGIAISGFYGAIGIGLLMCAVFVQKKWSQKTAFVLLLLALLSFIVLFGVNMPKFLRGDPDSLLGLIIVGVLLLFAAVAVIKLFHQMREDRWLNS